MSDSRKSKPSPVRLQKMHIGSLGINHFHPSNPWVAAWWSVSIPGFGHIFLGHYLKGLLFMSGEIACNLLGGINLTLLYSFTGQFERASQSVHYTWGLLYVSIYIFSIWDAYKLSGVNNRYVLLEQSQSSRVLHKNAVTAFELAALTRQVPVISAFWGFILPGLGHLYCHRMLTGFMMIGWSAAIFYYGNVPAAFIQTMTGQFDLIPGTVNYQWLLFYPSILLFSVYDAYCTARRHNDLYDEEVAYSLRHVLRGHPSI